MANELTEQATIDREEHTAFKAEIEQRITELEKWAQAWKEVIHALADCCDNAKKRNVTLVIREVINPYAETTTVELTLLESLQYGEN